MIRFYNGKVLSRQMDFHSAEVVVDGDKIVYVGSAPPAEYVYERQIDVAGGLLLAGFKNAHSHAAMTFLRSYADDLPLKEWLFDNILPMEELLTEEIVYIFTKLAIMEYLSSGITACFDMYYEPDACVAASIECGFRTVLCGGVAGDAKEVLRLQHNYNKFNNMHPLIGYRLGFHAEYTAEIGLLKEIAALAKLYKAPVFSHNAETRREVEECIERHGMTPAVFLDSLGLYEYGGGGFHFVHISEEDLRILREKALYVISCPASNAKLASGIAPLTLMRENGINIALGTDGAASNNGLDMFREMYLAAVMQKILRREADALEAKEVLKMATVTGAKAMGIDDCDEIAEGKQADLVVIDVNAVNMQPMISEVGNIVYSANKQNVALTMVAGKILYEKGEYFIGEDKDKIFSQANKLLKNMMP